MSVIFLTTLFEKDVYKFLASCIVIVDAPWSKDLVFMSWTRAPATLL